MKRRSIPAYYHELAERLGMTVGMLRRTMTSNEISDWMAYDRTYMSDSWYQTAMICCILSNMFRGKGSRPAKIKDFLPNRKTTEQQEDVSTKIMRYFGMHPNAKKAINDNRTKGNQ